jgi:hypothetical protein
MDAADVLALLDGVQAAAADSEPEAEAAEAQPRSAADILRLLDDPLAPRPLARGYKGRELALRNRNQKNKRAVSGKQRNAMVHICPR